MNEPTNADVLNAIVGLKAHIDRCFDRVNKRFDEIAKTLGEIQDSEHKRDLDLAGRVERIEQRLGIASS